MYTLKYWLYDLGQRLFPRHDNDNFMLCGHPACRAATAEHIADYDAVIERLKTQYGEQYGEGVSG